MKYKTKILSILFLSITILLLSGTAFAAQTIYVNQDYIQAYAGGDDSKFSDMEANYILTEDIDFSEMDLGPDWEWIPIGTLSPGVFFPVHLMVQVIEFLIFILIPMRIMLVFLGMSIPLIPMILQKSFEFQM
ncbi:MAG: hypothetical protein RBQ94_00390 [Methanimicrococcus sp.]|nr:hypothetical protein [Methanimicrococcus sp.]